MSELMFKMCKQTIKVSHSTWCSRNNSVKSIEIIVTAIAHIHCGEPRVDHNGVPSLNIQQPKYIAPLSSPAVYIVWE